MAFEAFKNVRIVFVDECSMIGSGMLKTIDSRLKSIMHNHEQPFGGMNMVFCCDLIQLPPFCQTPIYKRSKENFCCEIMWQALQYYPLVKVMRQADVSFSGILTKTGDGESLTDEERGIIESTFVTREYADKHFPDAIRLFFRTADVDAYNSASISGEDVVHHVANDTYAGCADVGKRASAIAKVHKMKANETRGMPFMLNLLAGKPYQITTSIDVLDGLVNGAIGILRYIERDEDARVKRLWLSFNRPKTGRLIRAKCDAHCDHIHSFKKAGSR